MELTKEQKRDLQNLKIHPWYKILEMIEEDTANELGKMLLKDDLTNEDNLNKIKRAQIYMTARGDFLRNTEKHLREMYVPIV